MFRLSRKRKPSRSNNSTNRLNSIEGLENRLLMAEAFYSTFLGGSGEEHGPKSIAIDDSGFAYAAGYTASADFYGDSTDGAADMYIAKIDTTGNPSSQEWTAVLGGGGSEVGGGMFGMATDSANNVYVTGYTQSTDFDVTFGASTGPGIFVAKYSNSGTQVYSTIIGEATPRDITVDTEGNVYVVGTVQDAAFGDGDIVYGSNDAFVAKYKPSATNPNEIVRDWVTFIGGDSTERAHSVDTYEKDLGNGATSTLVYVTGFTKSNNNFPIPEPADAVSTQLSGASDAFLAVLNSDNGNIDYGTYLGGTESAKGKTGTEQGRDIQVDSEGNAWITGNFYAKNFEGNSNIGGADAFVAKVNPNQGGGLEYFRFVGGGGNDFGHGIAVNGTDVFVTGVTYSSDLNPQNGLDCCSSLSGKSDGFVMKLDTDTNQIAYTYIGGSQDDESRSIAVGTDDSIVVGGATKSENGFPISNNAFDFSYAGGTSDAFITRITYGNTPPPPPSNDPIDMYVWGIGHETKSRGKNVDHRFSVQINSDSDNDSAAGANDVSVAAGVTVQIEIRNSSGDLIGTDQGDTDDHGVFHSKWFRGLASNETYTVNVLNVVDVDNVLANWVPDLDVPDDSDSDGTPDEQFYIP